METREQYREKSQSEIQDTHPHRQDTEKGGVEDCRGRVAEKNSDTES